MIKQEIKWLYQDEIDQANKDGWEVVQVISIDEYSRREKDFFDKRVEHMEPRYHCLLTKIEEQ